MKSPAEIQSRILELLDLELRRRVKSAAVKLPHHCVHNHRQPLDVRKLVDGEPNPNYNRILPVLNETRLPETLGLCMLGAEELDQWPGNICEDPIDAEKCPYFTPLQTDKELRVELMESIKDPAWVRDHIPSVSALVWVLDKGPKTPWWRRLWLKLFKPSHYRLLP